MGAFNPGRCPGLSQGALSGPPKPNAKTQRLARRHEQQRAALTALTESLRHQVFTRHCEMKTHTPRPAL